MTRVVALGGGHGLATTLRAVRRYADDITAIVSVADDGGSSGRLRKALGIPAPGDLRRCLVALAGDGERGDPVWAEVFEHRFGPDAGELAGHPVGNLVIAGLAAATKDFSAALQEAGRLLDIKGRVLPATTEAVTLVASAAAGEVAGQVAVQNAGRITHVRVEPHDAEAPRDAVEAIEAADQVVLGPGSLFTSVLAAAVVPALSQALDATRATTVYVANLREQHPETTGYDVGAHVDALAAHGIHPDVVVADPDALPIGDVDGPTLVREQVRADDGVAHDPTRLGQVLAALVGDRR